MTFQRCAVAYMAAHEAGWKSAAHRRQWPQSLRDHVYPVVGNLPIDQIDLDHVLAVLTPLWTAKPETASRVRSRIELVLDWAKVRGHAWIEREMIEHIVRSGWLDGKLKPRPKAKKPPPTADEIAAAKLAKLADRIRRWETKRRRAETAITKLNRQLRRLERNAA